MKVKELKAILEGVDDEMEVLIPSNKEFDGFFYSPCPGDSGVCQVGVGTAPDPLFQSPTEEALTQKPEDDCEEQDVFMLVPCGFGLEDSEADHQHLMN